MFPIFIASPPTASTLELHSHLRRLAVGIESSTEHANLHGGSTETLPHEPSHPLTNTEPVVSCNPKQGLYTRRACRHGDEAKTVTFKNKHLHVATTAIVKRAVSSTMLFPLRYLLEPGGPRLSSYSGICVQGFCLDPPIDQRPEGRWITNRD
jgi:hypothetical protein